MSKTKKITHDTPLQDEFPLTKEEDKLMERVRAGTEPTTKYHDLNSLLKKLKSQ